MRPEKERLFAESLFVCEGKSSREFAGILGAGTDERFVLHKWIEQFFEAERRKYVGN